MKRKAAVLALTVAMTMAVSGSVYAEPKSTEAGPGITENPEESEAGSSAAEGCEAGHHTWSEWTVTIPADCVTEGQQTRNCKLCKVTETVLIEKNDKHDLKEISRQEATEDSSGFILYECKREGCDYQRKEILLTEEETSSGEVDGEQNQEENTDIDEADINNSDADDTGENDCAENDNEEELPAEDTEEGSASFAYDSSSEIIAEYDPETASGTREIVSDPSDPSSTEEVEGKAVPEGIVEVKKDSDGNITDLAISDSVEEIKHGFSFKSESKTLHSIAIISSKVPGARWIVLNAKKPAFELGIHLKPTENGMIMTLTEDQKPVKIIKIAADKKKLVFTTSTGGSCEINQEIQNFTVNSEAKNSTEMEVYEVVFGGMNSSKPYIELTSSNILKSENISQTGDMSSQKDTKLYWLQQYNDEAQIPVVITIYQM